jgi:hypothetical protein
MNAHRSRLLTAAVLTAVLPAVPTAVPVSAGTRAPAVAVSDCWPTDNGDPVLTGLTTAPAVVDVTDGRTKNLTFRATAQDTGGLGAPTGVRRVRVGYGREPSDVLRSANLHRDSTGSWSGSLPFYPGSGPTGPRTVTWVQVEDWAGNTREYRHAELAAMGMGFDFRFVAPTPDVHRPRLRSLAVSRVSVDLRTARRTITFTARLTDDVSGVTEAGVTIGGPWEHFVSLHRVRGTALDGIWRGRFTFTPWEPRGRRYIGIEAYDGRGRAIFLDPSVLDRRGLPFRLTVATRDEPDSPVLRLVSATPGAVDVRTSGAMVHVVVRATDATSGVTEIRAGLTAPEYAGSSPQVHLRRVAGTAQDGRWEGDIPLGRCTSPAGQWSLYVYATDRAQHWA